MSCLVPAVQSHDPFLPPHLRLRALEYCETEMTTVPACEWNLFKSGSHKVLRRNNDAVDWKSMELIVSESCCVSEARPCSYEAEPMLHYDIRYGLSAEKHFPTNPPTEMTHTRSYADLLPILLSVFFNLRKKYPGYGQKKTTLTVIICDA